MNDTGYWSRPPLLTSVPRVWPWASSGDQCHVSPQLWRIKGEMESGWEERERERDSACVLCSKAWCPLLKALDWHVCVHGLHGTYMYIPGWMDGVFGEGGAGGATVGVMANLASRRFLISLTGRRWEHGAFMSLGSAVLSLSLRRGIRCKRETTKAARPK